VWFTLTAITIVEKLYHKLASGLHFLTVCFWRITFVFIRLQESSAGPLWKPDCSQRNR
jgi:hypothetical protein